MKKKISHLVGSTLLCSILAINMLTTPNISYATKKSVPKGIETLGNITNKYDLNGDNKVDVIKCKHTDKGGLKLYINNKLCLSKNEGYYGVQLCDLDKNDNYLDLFIAEYPGNDCVMNAYFTRYNGKSLDSKVKFIDGSYEIVKLDGNGKFYTRNYVGCDAIGSFNCYMHFQLKGNTITDVSEKTYKLLLITDKYQAAKSFQAYEKPGSKKVAYTVKKGNKVTFDTMYISETGIEYLRMKDANGKIGWIRSDQKGLFVNAVIAG